MKVKTVITPETQNIMQVVYSHKYRVGIFGGTFNPPHMGHLMIAQQVKDQLDLNKVMFMPDNIPPHVDTKKTIPAQKRLEMVNLATLDNSDFGVEDIEIKRGGVSYTIDTIKELIVRNPEIEYYLIIGGDMVEYLPTWNRIDELVRLVKIVGVGRPHYKQQSPYPILWVDVPQFDISSSLIRSKVHEGQTIKYLVPDSVEKYIRKEGLYK